MTQQNDPKQDLNKLTPYQMATLAILSIIALAIFALIFVLLRADQPQTQTIAPTYIAPTYIAPTLQPQIVDEPTLTLQQKHDKANSELHYAPNMAGTVVLQQKPIEETYPFVSTPQIDPTEQIQIDKALEDFKKNLPTRSK
jgi:hypothetical protein